MLISNIPVTIPIIAYHKISDKKEFGLTTIAPETFEKQIRILAESGFHPVTFKEIGSGLALPEKPIIITFDDGYECIYLNALPIMLNYGFKGIVYIVTDYIGKYNAWEAVSWQQKFRHLSAEQIIDLHQQGFEVGSHGKGHLFLPALSEHKIRSETGESKKFLEDLIGEKIISFCYPYGRYTKRVKSILAESGYTYAICNLNLFRKRRVDSLAMIRRSIYLTDSEKIFKEKVNNPFKFSLNTLEEILIQKGALLSIAISTPKEYSK